MRRMPQQLPGIAFSVTFVHTVILPKWLANRWQPNWYPPLASLGLFDHSLLLDVFFLGAPQWRAGVSFGKYPCDHLDFLGSLSRYFLGTFPRYSFSFFWQLVIWQLSHLTVVPSYSCLETTCNSIFLEDTVWLHVGYCETQSSEAFSQYLKKEKIMYIWTLVCKLKLKLKFGNLAYQYKNWHSQVQFWNALVEKLTDQLVAVYIHYIWSHRDEFELNHESSYNKYLQGRHNLAGVQCWGALMKILPRRTKKVQPLRSS